MMWFLVFLMVALTDAAWAGYTAAIAQGRRFAASAWSVAIIVLGGFAVTSYVQDTQLLIPAAAGAFVGTWFTVGRK